MASYGGSIGSLSLSGNTLAPGDNVIVPVAVFSDSTQVAGGAFVVHVESGPVNAWSNGGGNMLWSNTANWTGGVLPQNGDNVARFGGASSGGTVTLDSSASVEEIDFSNSGSSGYTIAALPGQTLTLSSTNGPASECLVNVLCGSHTISVPLALAAQGNLVNVTNPADCLTISGNVSGSRRPDEDRLRPAGAGGQQQLRGSHHHQRRHDRTRRPSLRCQVARRPWSTACWISARSAQPLVLTGSGTVNHSGTGGNTLAVSSGVFAGTIQNTGGTLALCKLGSGQLMLCGSNSYTGGTTIADGTLKLDFSQPGAPMTNIINNATDTSSLALGGGTLAIQGNLGTTTTNSQQFNGLAVNPGSSAIVLSSTSSNPLLLSLGAINRSPGGTVDFTLPSGTLSGSNGITTSAANTNGILGGYATVSGINWAVSYGTASSITAYSAYTGGNLGTLGSGGSLNVSPTGTQTAVTSAESFNTLNLSGTVGVSMTGSGSLTLLGGGLLGNTSGSIGGGVLTGSASGELIVITPANLTIGSVIADNGGATALTKAGPATLILTGSSTFSGVTTVGAGTLQVGNGGSGARSAGPAACWTMAVSFSTTATS